MFEFNIKFTKFNKQFVMFKFNIFIILLLIGSIQIVNSQQQEYISSIPIMESDQLLSINYQSITYNIQQLSSQSQPVYSNTYINKTVNVQSNEVLMYQSDMLSPIYVLDKEHCHSHEGTIIVQPLQHLSSHTINKLNKNSHTINKLNPKSQIDSDSYRKEQQDSKGQQQQEQYQDVQQQQVLLSSYIYNKKYNILYKINPNDLTLTVYKLNQQTFNQRLSHLSQSQQLINKNNNNNNNDYSYSYNQFQYVNSQQEQTNIYNTKSLTLLASISLSDINPNTSFNQCILTSSIELMLSKSYQSLYIFTCTNIFMVKCQSIISKVQTLMTFNSQQKKEFNRIFNGIQVESVNGYVFWLSQTQGIRIYGLTLQEKLQYITTIYVSQTQIHSINGNIQNINKNNKKDNNNTKQDKENIQNMQNNNKNDNYYILPFDIKFSSLQYSNGLLYVLTKSFGILVYQRELSFRFKLINYIDYLPEYKNKLNYQIIIKDNLMLIWTQLKKWAFVTQITILNKNKINLESVINSNNIDNTIDGNNYGKGNRNEYVLNRYFKGYRSINSIQLIQQSHINKKQSISTQTSNNKRQSSQIYSQVLMIISQKGIEVYPLGVDVREISTMMNGLVNNHIGDDYVQMIHIDQNIWLIQRILSTNTDNIKGDRQEEQQQEEIISQSNRQQRGIDDVGIQTQVLIGGLFIVYPSIECIYTQPGNYTILLQHSYYLYQQQQSNNNNNSNISDRFNNTTNKQSIKQNDNSISNVSNVNSLHYQPHLYYRVSITVSSTQSHLSLYISLLSIILLLLIISALIYWREHKLNLIDKIVSQIRRINASKRYLPQFNHQNSIDKKWNQLKQEILDEVSYKQQILDEVSYKIIDQDHQDHQDMHMSSQRGLTRQLYSLQNKNFTLFKNNFKENKNFTLFKSNNQQDKDKNEYHKSTILKKSQQNQQVQHKPIIQLKQYKQKQTIQQKKQKQTVPQKKQKQTIQQKPQNFTNNSNNKVPTHRINDSIKDNQQQINDHHIRDNQQQMNINNIKDSQQIQQDNQHPSLQQQQNRRTLHSELQMNNDNSILYKQLLQQRQSHQQLSINGEQHSISREQHSINNDDLYDNLTSSQQKHVNLSILQQEPID